MLTQDRTDSEASALTGAVRELARRTHFPVSFGGLVSDGNARIGAIYGSRTRSLDGLSVQVMRGLGGRAMAELRPRATPDYGAARHITHDYDRHILGEGISTLLAVPVIVGGRVRGLLYGGAWASTNVDEVVMKPAFQVADALATELRVRDEVERRLSALDAGPGLTGVSATSPAQHPSLPAAHREELRESYAELRTIASTITDPSVRARLEQVEQRLAVLSGDDDAQHQASTVTLSPRETDVLACAAIGATNAQIAAQLSLREGTVKAYLSSAMSKLDASTRHAAVTKARRSGLLP
ncbi:MAG: LuxR C-terminal-related transcriptional regulator [Microbacterium sp.]|uniref:LuxR C-terminal-related transcriptional regulator n=1 Tax=Microbacterium sp. TaxID=51671 RepID=UPI002728F2CF|nr:LuxR C-terminal-related transcriptional regulator [Microbacterium sp.]MDO8383972.1 LuxR C-terminal-related transcriptional regulator [Microbacterium sp.]